MRLDVTHSRSGGNPIAAGESELDEPLNAGEADVAGPWRIEEIPGVGFGLFREGERLGRGFQPVAVFADRWLAVLAAAGGPS